MVIAFLDGYFSRVCPYLLLVHFQSAVRFCQFLDQMIDVVLQMSGRLLGLCDVFTQLDSLEGKTMRILFEIL